MLCVEDLEGCGSTGSQCKVSITLGKSRGVGRRRAVLKMGDGSESGGNRKDPMERDGEHLETRGSPGAGDPEGRRVGAGTCAHGREEPVLL